MHFIILNRNFKKCVVCIYTMYTYAYLNKFAIFKAQFSLKSFFLVSLFAKIYLQNIRKLLS